MSATTTKAGTPLSTLGAAAAVAATDSVLMLVAGPNGVATPLMVPRSVLLTTALAKVGDTMTGPLILSQDPEQPLEAATMGYVDEKVASVATAVETVTATASQVAQAAGNATAAAGTAITAQKGEVNGLAPLGTLGELVLNEVSALQINGDGHYVLPATIPDTNDGFIPVAGSRVLYTDGGIPKIAI